jgi:hypothetical protein
MPSRSTRLLTLLVARCAAIAVASAGPAAAKGPASRACAAAYGDGQDRARAGHLREARDVFLKCAKMSCGGAQRKCAAAAEQTTSDLAQVAIVVTDAMDAPLVDVLVKMDGATLATHLFTFGARVGDPVRFVWTTRKIMVVEGQRGAISVVMPTLREETAAGSGEEATLAARQLDADTRTAPKKNPDQPTAAEAEDAKGAQDAMAAKDPNQTSDTPAHAMLAFTSIETLPALTPRRKASALPWVIGGVGVLGVGAGAALMALGKEQDAAIARCSPDCKGSIVERDHQLYLASDVALAAGGAVVGLAALLLVTLRPHEAASIGNVASSQARAAWGFDVGAIPSGGFLSVDGVF